MKLDSNLKILVTCLITMGVAAGIVMSLPPHGELAYTVDSINYLDAARNLVGGHGLSLFNFSLINPQYVPYTIWPPLYPLILATGINPEWIQALAIAGVAALACWLLARRARFPLPIACGLALLVTLTWPVLLDASYVWTEPLALLWMFVAIVALSQMGANGLRYPQRDVWFWLAAVVSVVMAIYTRYAAILFIPGVMLALSLAPISWGKRIALIIATPLIAAVLLAPLLIHNLMLSDHLSGGARIHAHMSLVQLLSSEFLYYSWMFAINSMIQALLVIFVISLFLVVAIYWKDSRGRSPRIDNSTTQQIKWLSWIAGSFVVAYFFGIVLLRDWKTFDWGPRILSLGMPFLLLTLAAWMQVMWKSASLRWEKVALTLPFLGILSLAGMTSFQLGSYVYQEWRVTGTPHWPKSPVQFYVNLAPVSLPGVKGLLLCDNPEVIAFRTGWEAREIPVDFRSRDILSRIAEKASGVVINTRKAGRLAEALRGFVDHPRLLRLDKVSVLVWKQAKDP